MSVSVEMVPVQKGFWSGIGSATKTVCIGFKDGVVWCGRMVKTLFTDYIIPAIRKIWPRIVAACKYLWNFIKTAPGLGALGCLLGVGAGLSILAIANKDSMKNRKVTRVALILLASLVFIAGAGALGAGIAFGVM